MEEELEEWRSVHSLGDLYEVSSLGRLRSVDRTVTCTRGPKSHSRFFPGQILKLSMRSGGYYGALVSIDHLQKPKYVFVHRLVAEAFLKGFSPDMRITHKDGDRSNNAASNLCAAVNKQQDFKLSYFRTLPVKDDDTGVVYLNYLDAEKALGIKQLLRCMRAGQACRGHHLSFVKT